MNFAELSQYFEIIVLIGCLCVGYIIKTSLDFIPNKYIPTILAILGIVLNVAKNGASLETIVLGMMMGLASTGMHQAFVQFIENND